ncbi:NADH dehydrogenase [Candidatus Bathyarchaeota archaeon]|nr:NADH dehydrogenase [Candidatus Bathyarchaeota archaeon]MBS7630354.1 NADH dehydrogenase [Candidatus Bathyarchaeota archaeon]
MTGNILLLMIMVTMGSSPIIYLLGRRIGKMVGWLSVAILMSVTVISIFLMPMVMEQRIIEEYMWTLPPVEFKFGLLGDGLSLPMLFTLIFVFSFAAVYSLTYMERRMREKDIEESNGKYAMFYTFFVLYSGSVAGAILSTNMIQYYLFFELSLVFSWLLVLIFGYGNRERTSLLYFLWTHVGGGFLLIGILSSFWSIGSFEIADLSKITNSSTGFWIGIAITLGLLVKIGGLGFHGWLPDTYSESPAPVSAVLGATSVLLVTYSLARLVLPFKEVLYGVSCWLELWALLTILYAGIMALVQRDTKRLVAYLSMSQMNYCVLGVFTYVEYGVLGALSYSISHGLAIALLFLVAGAILYGTGTRDMGKLGGLAEKMPAAIIASLVGFLTIGGVPPAVGFKSKFILLTGAFLRGFQNFGLELIIAIIAGTLATVITLAYEFRAIWRVYYGKLPSDIQKIKNIPATIAISLLMLSALSIIFGIWPALITNPLEEFIRHVFH